MAEVPGKEQDVECLWEDRQQEDSKRAAGAPTHRHEKAALLVGEGEVRGDWVFSTRLEQQEMRLAAQEGQWQAMLSEESELLPASSGRALGNLRRRPVRFLLENWPAASSMVDPLWGERRREGGRKVTAR